MYKQNGKYEKELPGLLSIENFISIYEKNIDDTLHSKLNQENQEYIKSIQKYIDEATNGDLRQREILRGYLKTRLLKDILVYKEEGREQRHVSTITLEEQQDYIDFILPFNDVDKLSARQKFEIILYKLKEINSNGYDRSFKKLKELYPCYIKSKDMGFENETKNEWYEYSEEDISNIYESLNITLSFDEKIDILTQYLYSEIYGLSAIDILAYSEVNEVGIANSGDYVYCWSGEKIHLSFINLSETDTQIIQDRSISFDKKAGQLDASNCEVLCYRADNARVTTAMPPYSSARILCIRLFDLSDAGFRDIVTSKKQQTLITTLIKLKKKIALQGGLGTGKTTTMKTLLEIIDDMYHIGSIEDYFEQHNRLKYLNKRVVELQMTEDKSIAEAVMSLFRLSVDVTIVGETREGEALLAFIQLAQAIDGCSFFTSHVATPYDAVPRYKNMLIATGKYFTEQSAVMDIVNYINIIFQHGIVDGKRCIPQIVEVVPLSNYSTELDISIDTPLEELQKIAYLQQIMQSPSYMYKLNILMQYEDGEFVYKNYPSSYTINKARENKDTWKAMQELLKEIEKDLGYSWEG
jgi:pilus assembly protein CpaF